MATARAEARRLFQARTRLNRFEQLERFKLLESIKPQPPDPDVRLSPVEASGASGRRPSEEQSFEGI